MVQRLSLHLFTLALIVLGCQGGPPYQASENRTVSKADNKIQVEAYLFDARLKRDGKPTSVRLRLLDRGNLMALGGRGYLGKGALKGWLSEDSISVYFPSTNEYLYESINSLIDSSVCEEFTGELNLYRYFKTLPDSIPGHSNLLINLVKAQKKKREYQISQPGCSWRIDLTYDQIDKNRWRIKRFFFDNGQGTTLKGKRREYKARAKVRESYFTTPIPPGAYRITP
jgi:hypothetical protein